MLDGNLVQENRSGSQKVTSEQLMIQQMSLMTQMMGIMAGNMQKKDSMEEKIAEESEVTRIPVRNSMYRRSQSATLRQISPRSESEKFNRELNRCNGLPLLELPGSSSATPRSNGKENANPKFTRSQSEPVRVPPLRQKTVVQEPKPRKATKEFTFIQLPGVGEEKEKAKEGGRNLRLVEYNSVARYLAQKEDQTRVRKCVLLDGQNMGHVNKPKTLPEKQEKTKPSVLVQSEPKSPHHKRVPQKSVLQHQDEKPFNREEFKADFEQIGAEIRRQFEQAQREVQQMHIEQIKKQARESIPAPIPAENQKHASPEPVPVLRSASKSSLKSNDSGKETLKKSISFHESIKTDSKTYSKSSDQSIEGLAEQVTAELEALRQTPDLGIDLSELNSLQKDIEPMSPSRPKFETEMETKSARSGRLSQRSRGVTASSERRKDQILTENNYLRENEALHMAKEVLSPEKSPPVKSASNSTAKKSPKKSPPKGSSSRSSSADRVYRNSTRGPPSSRPSSSKTQITIDPYRRPGNATNPANEPKWRERTRMEMARGTGLYSSTMKRSPSKPTVAPAAPKTSKELIGMTAAPKVRSVAQILEMTKVSVSEFMNTEDVPAPYQDDDELELSRHEFYEAEEDEEQFSTIPPEDGMGGHRSPSVESGLSSIYSLLNEVDNDYYRYMNDS
ncbi:Oidioi.mRNA.OKI2018_I69.XSR.g13945.t1.cds [Oikopleura dioica]|uniref:Oidioi.mRNA.OKI2018_I69.XSR.g13945.t1.cds n=1 Tax=Oikopleura dioica TaxID=34765 RepID=A0ABN7SEL3_OIKDI|nr:Oidioi.mRNA.OKI2018_I69.XSR.g13945.t1.cds [Oikopleura dioica]